MSACANCVSPYRVSGLNGFRRAPTLARAALSAQLSKTDRFGQCRPRRGVIWRDHRIVGGKLPFRAILIRRQAMGPQVPFQRLELFAVLQADQIFRRDRFADRHCRMLRLLVRGGILHPAGEPRQRVMNCLDQCRQFAFWERVIGENAATTSAAISRVSNWGMVISSSRTGLLRLGYYAGIPDSSRVGVT